MGRIEASRGGEDLDWLAAIGNACTVLAFALAVGSCPRRERDLFIDKLLARIHFNIEMILVDRPCAVGV